MELLQAPTRTSLLHQYEYLNRCIKYGKNMVDPDVVCCRIGSRSLCS